MSDFKGKMHQIRFRPRPRWGSLQRSPRPPSWWEGAGCPSPKTPLPLSALRASQFGPSGLTSSVRAWKFFTFISPWNHAQFVVAYVVNIRRLRLRRRIHCTANSHFPSLITKWRRLFVCISAKTKSIDQSVQSLTKSKGVVSRRMAIAYTFYSQPVQKNREKNSKRLS